MRRYFDASYAIGYATASTLQGPYTKPVAGNPWLSSINTPANGDVRCVANLSTPS